LLVFAKHTEFYRGKQTRKKEILSYDDYGFNALPGGLQYANGYFDYLGSEGIWWAASGNKERFEDHFILESSTTEAVIEECGTPQNMHSVRCIKD